MASKQVGAGTGGRDPELLPTPLLTPYRFEDFTEALLHRQRFVARPDRRLIEVSRWGRRGDKQDGIDFVGAYDDATTVTWQCKRVATMPPAKVRTYIGENIYTANTHVLVFSGLASPEARTEVLKVNGWSLLDQRDLGQLVHDLPLHRARTLLEQFWDPVVRRTFLPVPGIDAFLGLDEHFAPALDPAAVLHHRASLVGRDDVLAVLDTALDPAEAAPRIVLITGPGGRGKTRLALEALRHVEQAHPTIPVLVHQERRPLDSVALAELPSNPAVILTEDAHRVPEDLAPLLNCARRTAGTKLVITARATGTDEVRAVLQHAGFDTGQILEIPIEPLMLGAARALVDRLAAGGPALPAAFDEFLVAEGRDTPLIPVVAVSMARAGRLTAGPLALDQGFRGEILRAYADVIAGDLPGWSRPVVRNVLGTVAAVAPLPSSASDEFLDAAAAVAGVSRADLLAIVAAMIERGVIVERGAQLRVAPDVLADEVLGSVAVIRGRDTGFVTTVWQALCRHAGARLLVNLAELAWRLARTGGPDIFGRVWEDIEAERDAADLQQVDALAHTLAPLAYTQPERLFTLLTSVLARLPALEQVARVATENTVTDDAQDEASEDNARPPRRPQETPPAAPIPYRSWLTADNVARGFAPLLARCAHTTPELLGPALDILWDHAANDDRQTNQHPDHPARLICDDLIDLRRIAEGSLHVVLDHVETWLHVPDAPQAPRTPLSALDPLLAKEGVRDARRRNALEFSPFFVPPDKVAGIRDRSRRILIVQGSGADVRRAVEAAHLLGTAMTPPHGYFGHTVPPEIVLSWQNDDLATVAALRQVAQTTNEPLVRRTIRHELEEDATRALSAKVRRAALELVTELDERVEDDLTEAILGRWVRLLTSRRGIAVPQEGTDRGEQGGGPPGSDDLPDSATIVDEGTAERSRNLDAAVATLWREHSPGEVIDVLDERLRVIMAARQSGEVQGMCELLARLGAARPMAVPDLVAAAIALPNSRLDRFVHVLLDAWARSDIDAFLNALPGLIAARPGMASAVADGFSVHRWANLDPRLAQAHREATVGADQQLRGQWLAGAGEILRNDPVAAVPLIIDAAAGTSGYWGVAEALEAASRYDADSWTASLDEEQSLAVLALTRVCGWHKWGMQRIVAGIARTHPRAVLDVIAEDPADRPAGDEVDGLPAALASHAAVLADWLRDLLRAGPDDEWRIARQLPIVLGESLTDGAATAVSDVVASAGADDLLRLVRMLWNCDGFTVAHPDLVVALLARAEALLDGEALEEVKGRLVAAAVPSGGRWSAAAADETHIARLNRALQLAQDMTLSASARTIFNDTATTIQKVMNHNAQQLHDSEN